MTARHRTARERAAQASALAAIQRAQTRTRPQTEPDHEPYYPVTPAVARTIRLEIEEDRRHA